MHTEALDWVHGALSTARFDRYRTAADGDAEVALRLYQWNIELSEAFYGPLHWLEVSLRNALNERLRRRFGRDDWWAVAPLRSNGQHKVAHAKHKLRRKEVVEPTADDIVAELTFGFWVSLLSRSNDRDFWIPALHGAFPHYSGPRDQLHHDLIRMLDLRNRIMHHEPIFDGDLTTHRERIFRLLGYLSPHVVAQVRQHDRGPEVLMRWGGAGGTGHAGHS
ncbi:hypothetical protein HUO13_34935 [Saccharopolyspora erythraea]|uniref:hypothetical protein n=1 Tax=Saccharopolyspora erythraea TaxID=1836 RepID=UPI001BA5B398|nr:hypothetical protein [Saccharopolyspora erythraea]QUH05284.1 hypothetical protein HUO13_34935 [Saccharopolyspora erythraea]